jgi:uncharacterized caspase-like protein
MNPIYESSYSNSWALVIGINRYFHVSPLSQATNDATEVARILESRFSFPKSQIVLLLDENATKDAISKSFLRFINGPEIQTNDRLLLFFAGHGHTRSGKRGEVGFLVPVDGRADDLTSLIRWDEFTRYADLIPAKHIFFIMDACYGGLILQRSPAFGSMRFLGDMLQRYTRQVLTAGKADETVADGNGVRPGHSIFTAHLLDALEGSAATKDGIVTASGVMAYVYDRVARDQYSLQTPHYGFIEGDGDFIFDTSLLDRLREQARSDHHETAGEKDVLINTSPQMAEQNTDSPLVQTMKELLSDPTKKIKLDDFVAHHLRRLLEQTDLRHFPVQGSSVQKEQFAERIGKYEEISTDLQQIVILLAKWAEGDQLRLLERIFSMLAEADKGSGGLMIWLRLTWYPTLLLVYSAGISSLASRKYDALAIALQTTVQADTERKRQPLIVPVINNLTELHETFKSLPGHERHYVPRSEHLFKILQPLLEDMLLLGKRYESLFDEFEILVALTYADAAGRDWGPPGRFGWKQNQYSERPFSQVVEEARRKGNSWGPLQAGLFKGSIEEFSKTAETYDKELLSKLHWF